MVASAEDYTTFTYDERVGNPFRIDGSYNAHAAEVDSLTAT